MTWVKGTGLSREGKGKGGGWVCELEGSGKGREGKGGSNVMKISVMGRER